MNIHYYLIAFLLLPLASFAQDKRALIIAIDEYPRGSGWEEIHATNDAGLIEKTLRNDHNYTHIKKLYNQQATKSNIINALDLLYKESSPGNHIHIHFSCHGQQMMDDNGDEEDGLDEALIPYDAQFWYQPSVYEGKNHLRDDELGKWIKKLREKTGKNGQIVLTLDACHSGTANRVTDDNDYIRGTSYIFAPDNYKPIPGQHTELSLKFADDSLLAPACVFSACLSKEINYEYFCKESSDYYGRLTYSFVTIINSINHPISFREFFLLMQIHNKKLTLNPKKKQTFYFECSDMDKIYNAKTQ